MEIRVSAGTSAEASGGREDGDERRVQVSGGRGDPPEVHELREALADALFDGDEGELGRLAMAGVRRFGQVGSGGAGGARSWSSSAVLDRLSARTLMAGLLGTALAGQQRGELSERLARHTFTERIGRFERLVTDEVYRRIAEDKGPEEAARSVVRPPLERIDFLAATRTDLAAMRREIYPLARRLATRMTIDHRRGRRGQLDFRRTIRASLSNGGVPLDTQHKPRRPRKSELVILCDTSTSVASFARFALLLIYALREQFTRVRAFAFIDTVDEITEAFAPGAELDDALARMGERSDRPWIRGGTNYGRAFEDFARRYPDAVGPRTSLLILGDARANYLDLALPTLSAITERSRRSYWLNPEPRANWGSGDSAAPAYREVVPMYECRDLTQLGEFVHQLA